MSEADDEALRTSVRAGMATIAAAGAAAQADMATAATLRSQAQVLATTLQGQVDAFTPGSTYRPADLTAIRTAIASLLSAQLTVVNAMADSYAYRAANDANAVVTHGALEFIARYLFGEPGE